MRPERFDRLREVLDRRQPDLTVLMERVHKPHNLAAILRSCDAVGVLEVHAVPPEGGMELSRRASAGSSKWVRMRRHRDTRMAATRLRESGMRIVAAHPGPGATDYRAVDWCRPTALLVGTELEGLTGEALDLADERAAIPLEGMVRSLNVSVAAALMLFEARRQREEAGLYEASRIAPELRRKLLFEWAYPRIARRCRREGVPYPPLSDEGAILRGAGT